MKRYSQVPYPAQDIKREDNRKTKDGNPLTEVLCRLTLIK